MQPKEYVEGVKNMSGDGGGDGGSDGDGGSEGEEALDVDLGSDSGSDSGMSDWLRRYIRNPSHHLNLILNRLFTLTIPNLKIDNLEKRIQNWWMFNK